MYFPPAQPSQPSQPPSLDPTRPSLSTATSDNIHGNSASELHQYGPDLLQLSEDAVGIYIAVLHRWSRDLSEFAVGVVGALHDSRVPQRLVRALHALVPLLQALVHRRVLPTHPNESAHRQREHRKRTARDQTSLQAHPAPCPARTPGLADVERNGTEKRCT
eukprot:479943-Rhodomonas_salina.2